MFHDGGTRSPVLLLVSLLLLVTMPLVAGQACDTSVYHVSPQGACNICPDNCPPECDPTTDSYLVFASSDCEGQGVSTPTTTNATDTTAATAAPSVLNITVQIVPSNMSCDGLDSCSPQECIVDDVSPDCDFGDNPPVAWQTELDAMTCQECTVGENTVNEKCGSNLATNFPTDAGIQAAYCNEDFLVIWSSGFPRYDPSTEDYLGSIPLPAGGDDGCRVRTGRELLTVYKIPLELTVQTGANTNPNPLPGIPGLPAAGAVGVSLDGVPIYPNFNNRGQLAWTSCELDRCNAHAGRGEDYHYHGDTFGTHCLYDSDEEDEDDDHDDDELHHTPLIGYGMDGYNIHGRHVEAGLAGETVFLDSCGGHDHDGLGYHYHAFTLLNQTTDSLDGVPPNNAPFVFDAYYIAPTYCWHGNTDLISNFWQGVQQVNYDRSKTSSQAQWSDREDLRPCCESEHFYTAPGLVIQGSSGAANANNTTDTPADDDDDDDEGSDSSAATTTRLLWSAPWLLLALLLDTARFGL